MEEVVVVLLVAALVLSPLILGIVAIVRVGAARREIASLREEVARLRSGRAIPSPEPPLAQPAVAAIAREPAPAQAFTLRAADPDSLIPPPLPQMPSDTTEVQASSDARLEVALGGKVASFVGIAAVVLAVVFFVGYAIQHGWIGPALRVALGLLAGAALVAIGHLLDGKAGRFTVLARVLTGGGAGLFFFSTFAAYGIYHLIGPVVAAAALALSSAAVFALAGLYGSEIVAILGLLGAFLTPPLIRGDLDRGLFPMAYVAAVNVPVLLLGRRRSWQIVCNLAFVGTAILGALWLGHELPQHRPLALAAIGVLYAEFAILSRARAGDVRSQNGLGLDLARQIAAGLLLLGASYWITAQEPYLARRGLLFVLLAAVHVALAQVTRTKAGGLRAEALGFVVLALTFASLALPAQLDGPWVSIGWALEGVLLAWFARRERSRMLQAGAVVLGLVGLGKSLLFDQTLMPAEAEPFLNARFLVGMASALGIGLQGWLCRDTDDPDTPPAERGVQDLLVSAGLVGAALVPLIECATVSTGRSDWSWFLANLMFGVIGIAGTLLFARSRAAWRTAVVLTAMAPLLVLATATVSWLIGHDAMPGRNPQFWAQAVLIGVLTAWFLRVQPSERLGSAASVMLTLLALASGIGLVTLELHRLRSDSSITVFWSAAALALVLVGFWRRLPYLRYAGLALFALTAGKVFLIDLAGLGGLERVGAFLAAGVLLLVLSFAYQKVAPKLVPPAGEGKQP